jgi:hypothetical protein
MILRSVVSFAFSMIENALVEFFKLCCIKVLSFSYRINNSLS